MLLQRPFVYDDSCVCWRQQQQQQEQTSSWNARQQCQYDSQPPHRLLFCRASCIFLLYSAQFSSSMNPSGCGIGKRFSWSDQARSLAFTNMVVSGSASYDFMWYFVHLSSFGCGFWYTVKGRPFTCTRPLFTFSGKTPSAGCMKVTVPSFATRKIL